MEQRPGGLAGPVLSNNTEFTELPSRKSSLASSNFYKSDLSTATNPYELALINTTKEEKVSELPAWRWSLVTRVMQDPWEFPRHHLKFYGILGEGCFGQVWKCEALHMAGRAGPTTVAVKTLKGTASQKEREVQYSTALLASTLLTGCVQDLVKELNVMKMLYEDPHPNVVRLLGCCTAGSDKGERFVMEGRESVDTGDKPSSSACCTVGPDKG